MLGKKGGFCGVFREEEEEKFSASKELEEDAFLFLSQTKELVTKIWPHPFYD